MVLMNNIVPEFAVVGHPNEGKSSVVSTLAEDDSVRISPIPGETIECQTFTVVIDGQETIRFTDTPGFQNPKRVLAWMQDYQGSDALLLDSFLQEHQADDAFQDDCELLRPVAAGAGIIYVVDGSRPVRNADRAEMEILRLTGRPRLAIINCKDEETGYLESWKSEFRKHFNSVRIFNSHSATYRERIALLESLKSIDQDWEPALEKTIEAFRSDWQARNLVAADAICLLLDSCLTLSITRALPKNDQINLVKKGMMKAYGHKIDLFEKKAQQRIRSLYKHNIFNYALPSDFVIFQNIFSEDTWQLLGLSKRNLILAAAMSGAAFGGAFDVLLGGGSLGLFTVLGGASGAGYAISGGMENLSQKNLFGKSFGGRQVTIGPNKNLQFFYILLDRILLYYAHIINWAHGRRNAGNSEPDSKEKIDKIGFINSWDNEKKKVCAKLFDAIFSGNEPAKDEAIQNFKYMIITVLVEISQAKKNFHHS